MRLRTEIAWWLPSGNRLVYSGSPKSRAEWIRLTWRGYVGFWKLMIRAAYLIVKSRRETREPR